MVLSKVAEKAVDILLLVRPDYTIFDEVRRAQDFEVFADMRLAGVGMVGVVHASSPLDAIQRFMGESSWHGSSYFGHNNLCARWHYKAGL